MHCASMHKDVGTMVIKALDKTNVTKTTSSFELGMRRMSHGNFDSGLFWTYNDSGTIEVRTVFVSLLEWLQP